LLATEFAEQAISGSVSITEHTAKIIEEAKKANSEYHFFTAIAEKEAMQRAKELEALARQKKAKGKLFGVPISVKDAICVKGIESRGGSKILSGYRPLFNATSIQKLLDEGAIIIGKTSQDEFGFGSFSKNIGIGFEKPLNPFDKKRVCGGSSGGCAGFAQKTQCAHISLGESTGGSIACPASFCGAFGFTPTYGRVSRYGLIDYASSLDKIGAISKNPEDAETMVRIISGKDPKESTTMGQPEYAQARPPKKYSAGIIKEFLGEGISQEARKAAESFVESLEKQGIETKEVSLPLLAKYGLAAYYILAATEASTNLAKYCGMRYGLEERLEGGFDEYFTKIRTNSLGSEAKLRIIMGTFARMSGFREAYYLKAAKARTKIIQEYREAFKKADFLVNPTMPIIAPTFEEAERLSPMQNYAMDLCTVPANLAGMPHYSANTGTHKGMPIGIMVTANHFEEAKLFDFAKKTNFAKKTGAK